LLRRSFLIVLLQLPQSDKLQLMVLA
jgi:hypothetical protein